MKLRKGIKKLKFWSKNKNKYQKLLNHPYNFQTPSYHPPPPPLRPPPPRPPPPQEAFHFHFYQPVEPSAPPLPPWLEMQLEPQPDPEPELEPESEPETEPEIEPEPDGEDCRNISSQEICVYDPATASADCSIEKDGVYSGSGKGAGVLGCVVEVGGFVFRCLFPCFRISDIHSKHIPPFHNLDFDHNKLL